MRQPRDRKQCWPKCRLYLGSLSADAADGTQMAKRKKESQRLSEKHVRQNASERNWHKP
jgi:predicted alpha/beta superfamily hydrolase